jgi:hypothetical protein
VPNHTSTRLAARPRGITRPPGRASWTGRTPATARTLPDYGESQALERLSLSSSHISPRALLVVAEGASFVATRCTGRAGRPTNCGTRGPIHGFSKQSRHRLLDAANAIQPDALPNHGKFVTLTYGPDYPTDNERVMADLDAIRKRVERKFGVFCAIWREEFQERGAPHFHLMLWVERYIPFAWLRKNWTEIAWPNAPAGQYCRVRLERMHSWGGTLHYIAKYMAKPLPEALQSATTGRQWGIWRRGMLPVEFLQAVITHAEFLAVRELVQRERIGPDGRMYFADAWNGARCYASGEFAFEVLDAVLSGRYESQFRLHVMPDHEARMAAEARTAGRAPPDEGEF